MAVRAVDRGQEAAGLLKLYADASAVLKLVFDEPESPTMLEIWELAEEAVSATHGYVEGHAAIARRVRSRHGATARALLDDCWEQMQAVPIDDGLIVLAARVAGLYRLRAHDAIHLAAAVQTGPDLIFVSWDNELAAAARSAGLETLPAW